MYEPAQLAFLKMIMYTHDEVRFGERPDLSILSIMLMARQIDNRNNQNDIYQKTCKAL
jgi:hypothetical protein